MSAETGFLMTQRHFRKRNTAAQCLDHEWLNPKRDAKTDDSAEDNDADAEKNSAVGGKSDDQLNASKKNLADNKEHWDKENNYVLFDCGSRTMCKTSQDSDMSVLSDSRKRMAEDQLQQSNGKRSKTPLMDEIEESVITLEQVQQKADEIKEKRMSGISVDSLDSSLLKSNDFFDELCCNTEEDMHADDEETTTDAPTPTPDISEMSVPIVDARTLLPTIMLNEGEAEKWISEVGDQTLWQAAERTLTPLWEVANIKSPLIGASSPSLASAVSRSDTETSLSNRLAPTLTTSDYNKIILDTKHLVATNQLPYVVRLQTSDSGEESDKATTSESGPERELPRSRELPPRPPPESPALDVETPVETPETLNPSDQPTPPPTTKTPETPVQESPDVATPELPPKDQSHQQTPKGPPLAPKPQLAPVDNGSVEVEITPVTPRPSFMASYSRPGSACGSSPTPYVRPGSRQSPISPVVPKIPPPVPKRQSYPCVSIPPAHTKLDELQELVESLEASVSNETNEDMKHLLTEVDERIRVSLDIKPDHSRDNVSSVRDDLSKVRKDLNVIKSNISETRHDIATRRQPIMVRNVSISFKKTFLTMQAVVAFWQKITT